MLDFSEEVVLAQEEDEEDEDGLDGDAYNLL